jgi:hypothetical protein
MLSLPTMPAEDVDKLEAHPTFIGSMNGLNLA